MDTDHILLVVLLFFIPHHTPHVLADHSQGTLSPLSNHILHYEPLSYSPVHRGRVKKSPSLDTHTLISFQALDRNFTLDLWPSNDVYSQDAQILVHTDQGVVPSSYDRTSFYKGRVMGDPGSRVHGHIRHGIFDGEIVTTGGTYHIETSDKYFNSSTHFHSVIYSLDHVRFTVDGKEPSCGAKRKLLAELERLQATAKPIDSSKRHSLLKKRDTQRKDMHTTTLSSQFNKHGLHRRTETVSNGRYCPIFIAADHTFVNSVGGGSEDSSIAEITSIFASVQEIFNRADFDEDGSPDNIVPILVRTELLTTSSYGGLFADDNIAVSTYLDNWSTIDHDEYCLALLLAYRDFDNGVLGLAWVAQPPGGSRGGICEKRSSLSIGSRNLNTAIVTYLNYGQRQPRAVTSITIAHEFGHNFGSSHDPEGSDQCSPGGSSGNYIMYFSATDGNRPNNNEFSSCSKAAIEQIITTKSDCFTDSAAFCGNQITESGEECDCGSSDVQECASVDPCCEPGMCVLKTNAQCSAKDKCCVSDTCSFQPQGKVCQVETDCGKPSVCNGASSLCPLQVNKEQPCNNGTRYCVDAECTGSVCLRLGREDCQCMVESEQCHVCCMIDETCVSTFTLASDGTLPTPGQYRDSGRSCNDYTGYCSDDRIPVCIGVDNEQTLNDLEDLFSLDTLNSVLSWLKSYWWVPILVVVVIIIVILLLHFTYRKRKPIKKAARRASLSVRRQSEATSAAESAAAAREKVKRENREKIQRLRKFFPSCDQETLISIFRSCKTEEKTIRQLISIGYPMKKVPLPRV